jgi:hypothetical protein
MARDCGLSNNYLSWPANAGHPVCLDETAPGELSTKVQFAMTLLMLTWVARIHGP